MGSALLGSLREVIGETKIAPAPVASSVRNRFMDAMQRASGSKKRREVTVVAGFHGTSVRNHQSIFDRGLLIPGDGNDLKIVNGAAHGHGVYVAQKNAAWLSFGFCSSPKMFVCAVLDVGHVTYHGDAMVVAKSAHVIPLFVASGLGFRCPVAKPLSLKAQRHVAASNTSKGKPGTQSSSSKKPLPKLCADDECKVH